VTLSDPDGPYIISFPSQHLQFLVTKRAKDGGVNIDIDIDIVKAVFPEKTDRGK
jgi:hypothetical protein